MTKASGSKRARWGEGRVAYAALAPEIAKALEDGLPMTKVYALFEVHPLRQSSRKGERP